MRAINFYWNRVWGLGIAGDTWFQCDEDRPLWSRRMLELKIFLGPLLICATLPLGSWHDKLS